MKTFSIKTEVNNKNSTLFSIAKIFTMFIFSLLLFLTFKSEIIFADNFSWGSTSNTNFSVSGNTYTTDKDNATLTIKANYVSSNNHKMKGMKANWDGKTYTNGEYCSASDRSASLTLHIGNYSSISDNCQGGSYHLYVPQSTAKGTHTFYAIAISKHYTRNMWHDTNHEGTKYTIVCNVDETSPYISVTLDSTYYNSGINIDYTVSDYGSGLDRIEFYANDELLSGQTITLSGTYASKTDLYINLEGYYNPYFYAYVYDKKGNGEMSTIEFLTTDTQYPVISLKAGSEFGEYVNSRDIILHVSVDDGKKSTFLAWDLTENGNALEINNPNEVTYSSYYKLSDSIGWHNITLTAMDKAGNVSNATISVYYDPISPSVTMDSLLSDQSSSNRYAYTHVTGITVEASTTDTGSGINYIWIYDNDRLVHEGSYGDSWLTKSITLSSNQGNHRIKVQVKDKADNYGSGYLDIYYDCTNPTIGSFTAKGNSSADAGYSNTTNIKVNAMLKDDQSGIESYKIYDNSTLLKNVTPSSNNFTLSDTISISTSNGTHNIKIVLRDMAYNSIEQTISIILDTVSPSLSNEYIYDYTTGKNGAKFIVGNINLNVNVSDTHFKKIFAQVSGVTSSCTETSRGYSCTNPYGVSFDTAHVFRMDYYDKAGNITYGTEFTFVGIDNSRIINFTSLKSHFQGAYEDNLMGQQAVTQGNLKLIYEATNLNYVDVDSGQLHLGMEEQDYNILYQHHVNSNTTFNLVNNYSASGNTLNDWYYLLNGESYDTLIYSVKNIYGQYATGILTCNFNIDLDSPTGSMIIKLSNGTYSEYTNSLTVRGYVNTSDANSGLNKIMFYDGNTNIINVDITGYGKEHDTWCTLNLNNFQGLHTIKAYVYDNAGNSVYIDDTITYDSIAPTIGDYSLLKSKLNNDIEYVKDQSNGIKIQASDTNGVASISFKICLNSNCPVNDVEDSSIVDKYKSITLANIGGDYDGEYTVTITVYDLASNSSTITGTFIYDTVKPTLKRDFDQKSSQMTITLEDVNASSSIDVGDIVFYTTKKEKDINIYNIKNWLTTVNTAEYPKFVIPRGNQKIYFRIADKYTDYAGNIVDGIASGNYIYNSYDLNNNYSGSDSTLQYVDDSYFSDLKNHKFNDDILVLESTDNDFYANYNLISLNQDLKKSGLELLYTPGVDQKDDKVGTYVYDSVIAYDGSGYIISLIDIIILVHNPVLTKSSIAQPLSVTLNQGEELTNFGVSFVSPLGLNLNVKEEISLNGVRVDRIDTDLPGTYSIRTIAKDTMGQLSYIDRVVVVVKEKEEVKEEIKEVVSPIIKEEIKTNNTEVNSEKEVKNSNEIQLQVFVLDNKSNLETIKGGKDSILEKAQIFTFKLFSKYFFKVYDG